MTYFKNVDLASKYNISEATVRNWVKITKEGKLNLALHEENGRTYVANEPGNLKVIEKLVAENKKYRNSRSSKTIKPHSRFYQEFNQEHIYDIVRNLETHHEIPLQYNYFINGAEEWDKFITKAVASGEPSLAGRTIELVNDNQGYINKRIERYEKVNVVDLGVGNALPARSLLENLLAQNKLGRYIAIDISKAMLEVAEHNIREWFGDKVIFESHQLDMASQQFATIFSQDFVQDFDTANIALLFGGTADNLRNPDDAFRTINSSMNADDILIFTDKLETDDMHPEWFNHSESGKVAFPPFHRQVFDLLNIDESLYEAVMGFDPKSQQRFAKAKLKVALTICFEFDKGQHKVQFEKGESILVWRSWQVSPKSLFKQFDRTGFYITHSSQTEDHEYIMNIAEVKRS